MQSGQEIETAVVFNREDLKRWIKENTSKRHFPKTYNYETNQRKITRDQGRGRGEKGGGKGKWEGEVTVTIKIVKVITCLDRIVNVGKKKLRS